jgi:hypothetical protein|tara:strand:+ start:1677 stop:2024 length:348 start_codon:yes stop_codon:yes gene_type:complete
MSFRWPIKDPDEQLDYSVDWSRFLGTATISSVAWSVKSTEYGTETTLASGQTLATASSSATSDTIQNISQTNTTTVATINIAGGTANREYTFFCSMTDSTGSTAKRSVKLAVRDK